jgi:hypothetical protein
MVAIIVPTFFSSEIKRAALQNRKLVNRAPICGEKGGQRG